MISCHGWAGGTRIFFKGRLIETNLGGPHFCGSGAPASTWIPFQLSWCMGTQPQFGTRRSLGSGPGPDASKQLAARDGYLTAVSQLEWVGGSPGYPRILRFFPPQGSADLISIPCLKNATVVDRQTNVFPIQIWVDSRAL